MYALTSTGFLLLTGAHGFKRLRYVPCRCMNRWGLGLLYGIVGLRGAGSCWIGHVGLPICVFESLGAFCRSSESYTAMVGYRLAGGFRVPEARVLDLCALKWSKFEASTVIWNLAAG